MYPGCLLRGIHRDVNVAIGDGQGFQRLLVKLGGQARCPLDRPKVHGLRLGRDSAIHDPFYDLVKLLFCRTRELLFRGGQTGVPCGHHFMNGLGGSHACIIHGTVFYPALLVRSWLVWHPRSSSVGTPFCGHLNSTRRRRGDHGSPQTQFRYGVRQDLKVINRHITRGKRH